MHTDENKRFDIRNIRRNTKNGVITEKDYEIYLFRLPDASDKIFNPEDSPVETEEFESKGEEGIQIRKRLAKKKMKGKGR